MRSRINVARAGLEWGGVTRLRPFETARTRSEYRGELPRGDADTLVGTGERQARRIVASLLAKRVLKSESTRAPLRLAFPTTLAARWMPGLFPERPSS
jgi:hypothetical protein